MKRVFTLALICALIISVFSGCGEIGETAKLLPASDVAGENVLRAAVLYSSASGDKGWEDTYSRMTQPLLYGFECEAVDVSGEYDLSGYDILYPDESVTKLEDTEALITAVRDFVRAGGGAYITNGFRDFFGLDFLGAESVYELGGYPYELSFPELGEDAAEIQGIISDFHTLYASYQDIDALVTKHYGYALKPSTAKALVKSGDAALYTMNDFGAGRVFYTSALLPNANSIAGTSLTARTAEQRSLADTTMGATRLLESAFASYVAKKTWGYSLWRVFGSFGRPAMSWELHFEEITGFENGSGVAFGELCREYGQVPGYTLIRSTYKWFLRAESVTYLLGSGEEPYGYSMDYEESAYSSGTHMAAGDRWLTLGEIEKGGSYFVDYPEQDYRAYPRVFDLDGDGERDIVSGSYDGKLWFFKGEGYTDRFRAAEGTALADSDGAQLSVPGYSAPELVDWDGDGEVDIICGADDGCVYLFHNNGDMTFEPMGVLLKTGLTGQALPALGDGAGETLLVGSNEGKLLRFRRTSEGYEAPEEIAVSGIAGTWLAPCAKDINMDGKTDIALGTFDGYVAKLLGDGEGGYEFSGYLDNEELNYKGNDYLKFGSYCVPTFAELNGDGAEELVCGSLEYGMAYPIDSEYFPGREGLQSSIDYIEENGFYLGVHFYTNQYASAEREDYELARQKEAMESYGIDVSRVGANQHTWFTSTLDIRQSFLSLWNNGLLWNSGFTPANNSSIYPQASAQNVISLPFYLTVDGERTILLQNCSTLLDADGAWADISAKYDMPINMYYHCDFTATDEETARAKLQLAEDFRRAHDYSFCMENQLMLSTAAAYNTSVSLAGNSGDVVDITLSTSEISKDGSLYDERYQQSVGARVSLGEALNGKHIETDADVWYRAGSELYIALNKPVRVYETAAERSGAHIINVNVPAELTVTESAARIAFTEGGMLQVTVLGVASTESEGWTVSEYDGRTLFTKYGAAETLKIDF